MIPLGGVYGHDVSPDGAWAIYRADADQWHVYELFRVSLHGWPQAVKLTPPMLPNHYVGEFSVAPDSSCVVYLVRGSSPAEDSRLYGVPLAGGAAVPLSPFIADDFYGLRITPDSSRVVYLAEQNSPIQTELFSAPLDGSAPAVQLNGTLQSAGDVLVGPIISPDGQRVAYIADQAVDGVDELYSVPIDRSLAPVKLNPTLVAGGDVASFLVYPWNGPEISPDSSTLVYRADQDEDEVIELYRVPLDGSAPALQLNAALVPGGDVSQLHISPDSSRVVYTADQVTDGAVELYSVPLAGGSPPTRLTPAYAAGRVATLIGIAPGSNRVVYRANQDVAGVDELYSVAIDGGSAPVKLNSPLVPGGDVLSAEIAPDGGRVVYRADQDVDEVFELYSVPIDGSAAPIRLHPPLAADSDVIAFELAPQGGQLVYRLAIVGVGVETWSAPIDGGEGRLLNHSTQALGTFTPDGNRLLYEASKLGVPELYAVPMSWPRSKRR
jgi:Tol biopolymer transport system component